MADPKERPSKVRKLDASHELDLSLVSDLKPKSIPNIENQNSLENFAHTQKNDDIVAMTEETSGSQAPAMSKNQLKKQKRREQWELGRADRASRRRDKIKEKKLRKAEERAELADKITRGELPAPTAEDRIRSTRPVQVPVGLVLDVDFNELMTEKEIISLGAQLTRSYSLNRSAPYKTHLAISSWGGALKTRFENVLSNTHLGWSGVLFFENEDFVAAGEALHKVMMAPGGGKVISALVRDEKTMSGQVEVTATSGLPYPENPTDHSVSTHIHETQDNSLQDKVIESRKGSSSTATPSVSITTPSLIYLTSDSPNTLQYLEPNTTYIIGGIVDKNRHKGLCYKRACERGIPTAKLPIGDYMKMQSRTVLTVNHVVEIMLKWIATNNWGESLTSVIPKRKQAVLRTKECNQGDPTACKTDLNSKHNDKKDTNENAS
ncbi:tRNA m(1)G methyltransferase domain-containing protein [Blumeria hordei DH14]|uniref:tRNA (guanine(9)-N1)-methyltransferase n=1 Tax=Blumeria graminis f. sp. hordei (strain DH14) TaxID=546991 RepID=N1J876_BLUG1|nr:tRNA m(1)G methyltransferase domain-containing protein [Blumeria hordei DH14]